MTEPATILRRAGALVVLAALLAGCTGGAEPVAPSASGGVEPSPSAAPERPPVELVVDMRDVRTDGVGSAPPPRRLREAVEAVHSTITELYTAGFVDPARWRDGEFPGVIPLFAGVARDEAHGDLRSLTLGPAASRLDAVRPRRAELGIRFLTDAADRPLVVVARMRFSGIGLEDGARRRIRHEGEYTLRRVNGRWRIVAYDVLARTIGQRSEASFLPGLPARDPLIVLVIGSDARPGQSPSGTRADSIHVVGVNPRRGRASVLGIPRDSWVSIPGGGSDKINAALVRGGPDLLVDTVERLTGIHIDAYLLTGFAGFQRMVRGIGGIDVVVPFPIFDRYAHARFRQGPEHLTGRKALAFARARHALPNGDFGRSLNQGRLLIATLATLRDRFASRGGAALFPWVIAAAEHLRTDLSLPDIVDLLLAAPAFDPARIRNEVALGGVGSAGGRSVVLLGGGAQAQFRDLARDGLLGG